MKAKIMKKLLTILPLVGMIVCASACREEPDPGKEPQPVDGNNLVIKFSVGQDMADTKATSVKKASRPSQIDKIALSEPGDADQVYLVVTDQCMDDAAYGAEEPATKGTPIYTQNFVALNPDINGVPYTFPEGGGTAPVEYTSGKSLLFGCIDKGRRTYAYDFGPATWPEGQKMLFFLSAPTTLDGCSGFTYSTPVDSKIGYNGVIDFNFSTPATAEAQKDVLFTSKSISKADYMRNSTQGSIVLFYHTLAGVKFKSANAENEDKHSFNVQTTIKSIKMTNILSEGHCKVTPTYDQEGYSQDDSNERGTTEAEGKQDVDKSEKCSIWTGVKTVKEYSLVNPGVVSYEDATVDFDDSFQGSDTQNYGDYNLNTADYSNTFYFVPQKTGYVKNDTDGTYTKASYDVELTIVYELSNHNGQFTKTVKFNSQDWKAGHIYTYTLSANTVEVLIDDDMSQDGRTKSNLTITNTGNTDAYMRVAVVANWYDKNHQIVAPWGGLTDTWDGECSLGEDKNVYDTENWTYNGGYYYYKWKVKPGYDIISELFSQYKVKDCNRTEYNMYAGKAHLEMDIMVQSFNASKIGEMAEYGWHTAAFDPHYDDARTADLN